MAQFVNPIYDTVFKYIMQDEKVAKVLIGSILKTRVEKITMNNNEYSAVLANGEKVFKLDFTATIVDSDGNHQLVHIEVQKALERGEIMRFREYLGVLYLDTTKCTTTTEKAANNRLVKVDHPLPIHSIYILGHELGDGLKHSVMHGDNVFYDQDNNIIDLPSNNDYINGLTHKVTFVIAPLTKQNVQTKLDKLLSIFSECDRYNPKKLVEIDEFLDNSDEYRTVMRALQKASTDPQLRGNLSLEQHAWENFVLLEDENRELKSQLAEQQSQLAEQQNQLADKDRNIAKKLSAMGQSVEEIADFLAIDIATVREYLG